MRSGNTGKSHDAKRALNVVLCAILTAVLVGLILFVSGCQIGSGTLKIPNNTANTNIIINKVVDSTQQTGDETQITALTPKQIAAKGFPSVVYITCYLQSSVSSGSGIIINSDGYIVTNAHVVSGSLETTVALYDGRTFGAELVGQDSFTDLAVLKITADNLVPADIGTSSSLSVGEFVCAIGNPGGLTWSATYGYVSALNRQVETTDGYTVNCIQTDAAINPGNSGGALFDSYGYVIGINSSKIAATDYEGLGFAISIDEAVTVVSELIEKGYVAGRATLGLSLTLTYLPSKVANATGTSIGAYVSAVPSGTSFKVGDYIVSIDGQALTSTSVYASVMKSKSPGDTVLVVLYRPTTTGSGWPMGYRTEYNKYTIDATLYEHTES